MYAVCILSSLVSPVIADDSLSNRCAEYRAQLKNLDCPGSFKAVVTFLSDNRKIVLNFAQKLSKEQDSVIAFNVALQDSSQEIHNCLVKHGREKNKTDSLITAEVKFATLHAGIDYWVRQKSVAAGAQDILERHYDEAIQAVSAAANQW